MLRFLNAIVQARFGHSGIAKRFRELSDGTFSRRRAGRNHNFAKKDAAARTRIRQPLLTDSTQTKILTKMIHT
jgi:ribosomal protein L35